LRGFKRVSLKLSDTEEVPPKECFDVNRKYLMRVERIGEWVYPPRIIICGGEACIHMDLKGEYPQHVAYDAEPESYLVLKRKNKFLESFKNKIRKLFGISN
jgi:hypothetical protein